MPCVLLTRPQERTEKLADNLRRMGYETLSAPMLALRPTGEPLPPFADCQALVVTSASAIDALDKVACRAAGLMAKPLYAVGTATAEVARAAGFAHVRSADGDGAALAALLRQDGDAARGCLLHMAGRDTDDAMAADLRDAGFSVRPWCLYAAEMATELPEDVAQRLREGRIDAALFFSARSAEAWEAVIRQAGMEACCSALIAIGISEAVAGRLRSLPWRQLRAAAHPSEAAVIEALREMLTVPGVS